MRQIADWLEELGMSEYAQCFAENKIDVSVLRHLTDQDLIDIGIPLGHRRKILAAIGELASPAAATPKRVAGAESKYPGHRRAPTNHSAVRGPCRTRRHSLSAWIRRTCVRSLRPIKNASPKPCIAPTVRSEIHG